MIKVIYFEYAKKNIYTLHCAYFKELFDMVSFDWATCSLQTLSKASAKPLSSEKIKFFQKGSPLNFILDVSLDLFQPQYVFYKGLRAPKKYKVPLDGTIAVPIVVDQKDLETRVYLYPELFLTHEAQESNEATFYRKADINESLFDWTCSFSVD